MKYKLSDICIYRNERIETSLLTPQNYISTENMLPNKRGVKDATSLPSVAKTRAFYKGDVLLSNIRPYFKKIWLAEFAGGCSNDVLVLRAKKGISKAYLFYLLSDDSFFDYAMATSKGTKMPRGDKKSIMCYQVPDFSFNEQRKIVSILKFLDRQIQLNDCINKNLAA